MSYSVNKKGQRELFEKAPLELLLDVIDIFQRVEQGRRTGNSGTSYEKYLTDYFSQFTCKEVSYKITIMKQQKTIGERESAGVRINSHPKSKYLVSEALHQRRNAT